MTQPSSQLFRQEALKHYLRAEEGKGLARVSPPWSWVLLWVVAALVASALLLSFVGSVEVNGRARGILRPGAVRPLVSQVGGIVTEVVAKSGQPVAPGTMLLRVNAAAMQSQMLEAQRHLESVQSEYRTFSARQDQTYAEQVGQLQRRIVMLQDQARSQEQSLGVFDRKVQANEKLLKEGLVSPIQVDEARESLAQAQRQLNSIRQGLGQTRQELASLQGRRQDELWQREQTSKQAKDKVDALGVSLEQSQIQAPEAGLLEAMLVKPGDVVQPGQVVGKLVPQGDPFQVVVFLPEKDRAFVKAGDAAVLELDQLPYSEYGTLQAKVVRISDDLAAPFELQEALGQGAKTDASVYRIELQVLDDAPAKKAGVRLRTGMLLNARFLLRKQKPITMVLDPLKRWFK